MKVTVSSSCRLPRGLPLPPCEPTNTIVEIAEFIIPYVNKPIASHRRTAINLVSTLLYHSLGDQRLIQSLITALLSRSGSDEDPLLRSEALSGFNNIIVHPYNDIQAFVSPILATLLSNFNDPALGVVLASMIVLHQMLDKLTDKTQIAAIIVNVILKVKSLFEHPTSEFAATLSRS